MDYFISILRDYPAIALFLTLGLGFWAGKLKYKAFSLGSVTSVLLVGILIGQAEIPISDQIKNVFFMMFLFSIGYSVGPGFFRSLKGIGLKQALFACCMGFSCFVATVVLAKVCGYSSGETVGLFSGSQTCSSLIGVGSEAIMNGVGTEAEKEAQINIVPICYAVTYVFGTLGTVIFLSMIAPRLLGGFAKVKAQVAELQSQYEMNPWRDDPAYVDAMRTVAFRSFVVENKFFADGLVTVADTEAWLRHHGVPLFVDRIRHKDGSVCMAEAERQISPGDVIVVSGRREIMVRLGSMIGREVASSRLSGFPVKQLPVLLRNKQLVGRPLSELLQMECMHGVLVKEIERGGVQVQLKPADPLHRGDILTIVGSRKSVNNASAHIGHADRPSTHTDIMFLALAIFIGGVIGTITVVFDNVPISFGTGGGSLIAGLVFGWLRSRRPTYGHIPRSVLWFMNQIGLNAFIAVVGLRAAPSFVAGLHTVGWGLLGIGAIATMVPLVFGLWLGHKVFKFNPAFTLGCCAGTRTCTAALGAVQDTLGSSLPTIGYTVTYAVSNVLLIFWGLMSVLIVS